MTKEEYRAYLLSSRWMFIANAVKARDGYRCRECGCRENLEVHHLSYAHVGAEEGHYEDLLTVCRKCHCKEHGLDVPPVSMRIAAKIAASRKSIENKLKSKSKRQRKKAARREAWRLNGEMRDVARDRMRERVVGRY